MTLPLLEPGAPSLYVRTEDATAYAARRLGGIPVVDETDRSSLLAGTRTGEIGLLHSWELVTAVDGPGTLSGGGAPGLEGGDGAAAPLAHREQLFHVLRRHDERRRAAVARDRHRLALRHVEQLAEAVLRFYRGNGRHRYSLK